MVPPVYRFEVAFSFASLHRESVRAIAALVSARLDPGLSKRHEGRVFLDEWFQHEILGSNMRRLFQRIFGEQSRMVVVFPSEEYAEGPWCQGEAEAIDALEMRIDSARDDAARLRVLKIQLGPGNLPGVSENTGFLEGQSLTAEEIADFIVERLQVLKSKIGIENRNDKGFSFAVSPAGTIPIRFIHPATNDDRYSRREKELEWLDSCAKNPDIRIATVTGPGGLGKTSLVGHWIEKRKDWRHWNFCGVLFYSFYSNRDPRAFFATLLEFVCEIHRIPSLPQDRMLHHMAARACQLWRYLIVLDGLEVLQNGEDEPTRYGWINDGELNEFVTRVGENGSSLLVLTSRFPFPKVTDEYPEHARAMELPLLNSSEGADLLSTCGLIDPFETLRTYSMQLGGHPLALRLFAGSCLEHPFSEPRQVMMEVCSLRDVESLPDPNESGIDDDERAKRRQWRQFFKLLIWFQRKLPSAKQRLLQLVSLFREPVATPTLVALAKGIKIKSLQDDLAVYDAAKITGVLEQLARQALLQKEPDGESVRWTAHPIIRDIFREQALTAGTELAQQFAEIVAGKGVWRLPTSVAEVTPIIESIEVLLAAGELVKADELYSDRLDNGQVFLTIPAPREGLRCTEAFLGRSSDAKCVDTESEARMTRYLYGAGLFASILGELDEATRRYEEVSVIYRSCNDWENFSVAILGIADAKILAGTLLDAEMYAGKAMHYSNSLVLMSSHVLAALPAWRADYSCCVSLALRGHALSLLGRLVDASRDFVAAVELARHAELSSHKRKFLPGLRWARHRMRLGELEAARRVTQRNSDISVKLAWNSTLTRCYLLLAELDITDWGRAAEISAADPICRFRKAEVRLLGALNIFRRTGSVEDLPDALLAMARFSFFRGTSQNALACLSSPTANSQQEKTTWRAIDRPAQPWDDETALSHCNEALRLASRNGFQLKKCDVLNFRATLFRSNGRLDEALADAEEARNIAGNCNYYWGHHEAVRQLRDTHVALGHTAESRDWASADEELTRQMAPEIKEARRINQEYDAEVCEEL